MKVSSIDQVLTKARYAFVSYSTAHIYILSSIIGIIPSSCIIILSLTLYYWALNASSQSRSILCLKKSAIRSLILNTYHSQHRRTSASCLTVNIAK